MENLLTALRKFWYAQNYAFCCSNEYLALNRGNAFEAGEWATKASEWEVLWWKEGRKLK